MWCRIYQWKMERQLDDGRKDFNDPLKRHLDQCPSCRRYARRLTVMAQRLGDQAPVILPQSLQPLNTRILRSAFELETVTQLETFVPMRHPFGAKIFAGAMAAGLLIVTSLLMMDMIQKNRIESVTSSIGIRTIQTSLPAMVAWPEKPIKAEVEQLKTDMQNAVTFLINCAPGQIVPLENSPEE